MWLHAGAKVRSFHRDIKHKLKVMSLEVDSACDVRWSRKSPNETPAYALSIQNEEQGHSNFSFRISIRFGLFSLAIFSPSVFLLLACVSCAWSTQYDDVALRCLMCLPYEYFPLVPPVHPPISPVGYGRHAKQAAGTRYVCHFHLILSTRCPLVSYSVCVNHSFEKAHMRNHRRNHF